MATEATTTPGGTHRGTSMRSRRASHHMRSAVQTVSVRTIGTSNRTTLHWRAANQASHAAPRTTAAIEVVLRLAEVPTVGAAAGAAARPGAASATVERVDLVLEVAHDDIALELQGRGEVAGRLGEVTLEQGELADRLGLGDRGVGLVDRTLDLGDHAVVGASRREGDAVEPVVGGPRRVHL